MDDTVDAAACAINHLGEVSLRTAARDIATLASRVAQEAGVGVAQGDRVKADALSEAADALSQADSEARSQCVTSVLNAAKELEPSIGGELDKLRGDAAALAHACLRYLDAVNSIGQVRRDAGWQPIQHEPVIAVSMWTRLLRRRRDGLLAVEEQPEQEIRDSSVIAVDYLRLESERRETLVPLALGVLQSADALRPVDELARIREALTRVEDSSSPSAAVADLRNMATELEGTATRELTTLRRPVAQLADACRAHLRAADAMEAVQRAAKERAQRRGSNAAVAVQVRDERPPDPGLGQVDSFNLALSGAINLLPYMGRAGVLQNTSAYTENYLWWVSLLFSSVWGALGAGLHAPEAGQCRVLLEFGRFCRHAATLGVTILVCCFCSWMLTPKSSTMLISLCAVFGVVHLALWILSFWRGRR